MDLDNSRNQIYLYLQDIYHDVECKDTSFLEESLKPYLTELYHDLMRRCKHSKQGIDKATFLEFCGLPYLIGERLFKMMKEDNKGIQEKDFVKVLMDLYTSDLNTKMQLAFNM